VRWAVRGKDAGSADIEPIWARPRTPPRAAQGGTATWLLFWIGLLQLLHVGPRDLRRVREDLCSKHVEIDDARTAREQPQSDVQERTSTNVEQIRVMEVDVDELRQVAPRESAGEVAERVSRGNRP
jgi:hypothetical protein